MAHLTSKMQDELDALLSAANGGLPADLKAYIEMSVDLLRHFTASYSDAYTRKELQGYIDTLSDLIDTKVHSR